MRSAVGPGRIIIASFLFAAVALLCFPRAAQAQIPPIQFSKHALLNGLEVFVLKEPAERAHFALMIKNGAAFDPVDKWGVTLLMTRMMTEKTERRTGVQIRQDLQTMGAEIQTRVGWDAIFFYGSAPHNRIEDVLTLLAEMVVRPLFDEETFATLRAGLIAEVVSEADNPELRTQRIFLSSLFQQNPYGHSVNGDAKTLANLSLNDIKIQYRRLVMPNQAQLALYYAGESADLLKTLGRRWGSWVKGTAAPFTFRQAERPAGVSVTLIDTPADPSLIRIGALGPRRGEPDYYPLKVLEQYLTLTLPQWAAEVARQKQIQASVLVQGMKMPGFIQLNIKAEPGQIAPYVARIWSTLADLRQGRIDPDLLKESKELAFLELRNRLAAPLPRLFELLEANLYELGVSYFTAYGLRLDRVAPDKLQEVLSKRVPQEAFLIVVSGSAAKLGPDLESLGRLEILN